MLSEEYLTNSVSKSTPGSRRVTPSKTLPTEVRTPNSRQDKKFGGSVSRISTSTVYRVLTTEIKCNYLIIDCRYPYEYSGGHIAGAINCPPSEKLSLMDWLFSSEHGVTRKGPMILIMHCEFSQCRAPRLATDIFRQYIGLGVDTGLEVYLMKGGYSEFYRQFPGWCDPMGYTPMHDYRLHDGSHVDMSFDADCFAERKSMSSQKESRRTRRMRPGFGSSSIAGDSPFFRTACSPMDYSPVGVIADLTKEFIEEETTRDDSSSGTGSAKSGRRNVYIHTEDDVSGDPGEYDNECDSSDDDGTSPLFGTLGRGSMSSSPSRSSSFSSNRSLPPAKRRASLPEKYFA